MAITRFRDFFRKISPTPLQGTLGREYVAAVFGLAGDMANNLLNMALKATWLQQDSSPDDALAPVGVNSNLPRYFTDTDATYRARLLDRWNTWELAGTKAQLEGQAVLMGFLNARIFEAIQDWPTRPPAPYWSQFWLLIPTSDHNFTAGATYGDGSLFGAAGLTYGLSGVNAFEILNSLRIAMCLFKPGHTICREIIFEGTGGVTYGTGHLFGAPGLVFGGTANINIAVNC